MIANCAALTIAGSDSGGGAGIQADLKTFSALCVFGTTVITAITAQNLTSVSGVQSIEPQMVEKQFQAVIAGFPIRAIKTGMLYSAEIIYSVVRCLKPHSQIPLVVDPVMVATSGSILLREDAQEALTRALFPLATLITPNIPEATQLIAREIHSLKEMEITAQELANRFDTAVLLKGGHLQGEPVDILVTGTETVSLGGKPIPDVNKHGSGCTLAAAITAFLALGATLLQAVSAAKKYIESTMMHPLSLGPNRLVMDHFYPGNHLIISKDGASKEKHAKQK